jgi:TetR/AcrR family transcriptional regulator, cholesterol catabolism regulator
MEVHERIIEEATKQFLRYGTRSVTMDGIASSLGISKRTVYENFKDKTELVYTCLDTLTEEHEKRYQEIIFTPGNVIEIIFSFIREGIKNMNSINPVYFLDMKKYYQKKWNEMQETNLSNVSKLTRNLLKKGMEEGLFRQDINIPIIVKLFYEQMRLLSDEKIFPHDEYNFTDTFQNLTINFMRGISTARGIELIDEIIKKKKDETSHALSFTQEKHYK